MSAKHTPGEWVFEFKDDHTVIRSMEDCYRPGAGYVCHVNKNNVSEAEREANENLIAAAPDLLAACQRALEYVQADEEQHGRTFGVGNELRAAIAKAKGAPQ